MSLISSSAVCGRLRPASTRSPPRVVLDDRPWGLRVTRAEHPQPRPGSCSFPEDPPVRLRNSSAEGQPDNTGGVSVTQTEERERRGRDAGVFWLGSRSPGGAAAGFTLTVPVQPGGGSSRARMERSSALPPAGVSSWGRVQGDPLGSSSAGMLRVPCTGFGAGQPRPFPGNGEVV